MVLHDRDSLTPVKWILIDIEAKSTYLLIIVLFGLLSLVGWDEV